jgi:hypothetical protein
MYSNWYDKQAEKHEEDKLDWTVTRFPMHEVSAEDLSWLKAMVENQMLDELQRQEDLILQRND